MVLVLKLSIALALLASAGSKFHNLGAVITNVQYVLQWYVGDKLEMQRTRQEVKSSISN